MKQPNEKGPFFLAVVFVCLCCFIGCTSHRQTHTRSNLTAADTVHITEHSDTVATIDAHQERGHFDVSHSADLAGMLTIDRDSAGRPVRYCWESWANSTASGSKLSQDYGLEVGYKASVDKDSTHNLASNTQEDTTKESRSGSLVEKLAAGLLLLTFPIVTFILIKECIKTKK